MEFTIKRVDASFSIENNGFGYFARSRLLGCFYVGAGDNHLFLYFQDDEVIFTSIEEIKYSYDELAVEYKVPYWVDGDFFVNSLPMMEFINDRLDKSIITEKPKKNKPLVLVYPYHRPKGEAFKLSVSSYPFKMPKNYNPNNMMTLFDLVIKKVN